MLISCMQENCNPVAGALKQMALSDPASNFPFLRPRIHSTRNVYPFLLYYWTVLHTDLLNKSFVLFYKYEEGVVMRFSLKKRHSQILKKLLQVKTDKIDEIENRKKFKFILNVF